MKYILEVKNLNVDIGKPILKNINFNVKKYEKLGIIGESGSGKTTLLNILSSYYDKNLYKISGEIIKKGLVSMILQDSLNALNPYEKVGSQLMEEYARHNKIVDILEIKKYLRKMGFDDTDRIIKAYPNELSGGMRQRISIILTLMNKNVEILLADEPTTALDIDNQKKFVKFLREICDKNNLTLIYVSHDMRIVSLLCDEIMVLKDGNIVEKGRKKQILNDPQDKYTKLLVEAYHFFEE